MRYAPLLVGLVGLLSGCSSSANPPISTSAIGEKVRLGKLTYSVFDTQWLTHLGDTTTGRVPQNRFLLIRFSVLNTGGPEVTAPALIIQDDQGRTFDELPNGEGVPQWAGYLRNLKSSESVQGNALFDAPPAHYKLKLSDETSTKFEFVDLPLSFGTDAPAVPLPTAK
jgi:hypothetical protein